MGGAVDSDWSLPLWKRGGGRSAVFIMEDLGLWGRVQEGFGLLTWFEWEDKLKGLFCSWKKKKPKIEKVKKKKNREDASVEFEDRTWPSTAQETTAELGSSLYQKIGGETSFCKKYIKKEEIWNQDGPWTILTPWLRPWLG